jgi:hypothetical protein
MSQAQHSGYESGETYHQHSENAQFEAEIDLSWRDLEIGANLKTVGTAVREGAEKLEAFMQKVLELTKVLAGAAVAVAALITVKVLAELKL